MTVLAAGLLAAALVSPPSGDYSVSLPFGWTVSKDWDAPEPGVQARGPDGAATIGVVYFPSDKSEFKDAEAYLARQQAPVPLKTVAVAGKKAFRFDRTISLPPKPERGAPPARVEQVRVVLPVEKGFYLFLLDATPGSGKGRAEFKAMVASFKLRKRT